MNLILPDYAPSELKAVPIIDYRGKYPINPKYSWESLKGKRNVNDLSTQIFHHDAINKLSTTSYSDEELIRRIAVSHVNSTKNLPGGDNFPYHLWIRNGKVYLCNGFEALTFGVASNNTYTVHICVSGNYTIDTLTDADRNALYAAHIIAKLNMPKYKNAVGHKELSPTSCPGYSMDKVRTDISSIDEQMNYNSSISSDRVKSFAVAERVVDLGTKLNDPKYGSESRRKVMLLSNAVNQTGKDGSTAESIVECVKDLYNKAMSGKFIDEATRKLMGIYIVAKEKGLL